MIQGNKISSSSILLKENQYDGVSYVSPAWDQMGEYTFRLARQILDSEEKFDRVVALAKGGWTWARTLVDYLGIDEISSVRFKSYQGVNEAVEPQIIQPLTDRINGENILLFDEVIDSGETIKRASEYLRIMGAKSIRIAALCYKPYSCVVPDYFAFETSAWVVFPHEIREFIEASYHKWQLNRISIKEIRKRFDKLGLPEDQVEFFLGKINS
ncbi:MAG: Purine phosphoribosyltransferase [Microgenomates group bacterium GW2011_GWA2_37_6]|nr:MAG: Purine phosphoribosyltransferase [Microgenomates group bacterium GW2011_GWA2_37_6]